MYGVAGLKRRISTVEIPHESRPCPLQNSLLFNVKVCRFGVEWFGLVAALFDSRTSRQFFATLEGCEAGGSPFSLLRGLDLFRRNSILAR